MWSQDYISAPWSMEDLFDQLTTSFTDTAAGWTVHEDNTSGEYPHIIFRSQQGTGHDVCMWIDLTTSDYVAGDIIYRVFLFEPDEYTLGTNEPPSARVYQTAGNLETGTNLLITTAGTDNKKNQIWWFEQGTWVGEPNAVFQIKPHTLSDGVTLLNNGDDGTSWPLWAGLAYAWSSQITGTNFSRSASSFDTYLTRSYQSGTYLPSRLLASKNSGVSDSIQSTNYSNLGTYFLKAPRSPTNNWYAVTAKGAGMNIASSVFGTNQYGTYIRLPKKRIDAWSGGGVLTEAFRPELFSGDLSSGDYLVDLRGYIGEDGEVLIASTFGGALGDSFSLNSNEYRIVMITTGQYFNMSWAIKV